MESDGNAVTVGGMLAQTTFADDSEEYRAFVEKFKPKKTTDDCYTPENVYDAIAEWAAKKYGFDRSQIVRPFWPGGDYTRFDYPEGCVVLDNPPFSILSQIVRRFSGCGMRYFLFAPSLTLFSTAGGECNYVAAGANVTFANGAVVNIGFVTNMGDCAVETAPDLHALISAEDAKNTAAKTAERRKYVFPAAVLTSAHASTLAAKGVALKIKREESAFVRTIDAMRCSGKVVFGGAFLVTERAAAERAAAERAAAERAAAERAFRYELSPRERKIQQMLGTRASGRPETGGENA